MVAAAKRRIPPPTRADCLSTLADLAGVLPDRELRVLTRIATRLHRGWQQYGRLYPHKRPWVREAQEEHLDAVVYLTCELEDADD